MRRTTDHGPRTTFLRCLFLALVSQFIIHNSAFPQQPQAQSGQQIFPVNAKFVQGFGPGYWPTAGSSLNLNLAPGTAVCSNTVRTYAGGTLTLAPSVTNYVYLDPTHNCTPASNTTGFTNATIPIATAVTTNMGISLVTDVRTLFVSNGLINPGTVTSVGMSGDGIIFSPTVPGSPTTTSGTFTPQLLTQTANTVLAGPGTGPAATPSFRALTVADLPATISSNTSGAAAMAAELTATPTQCPGGQFAQGITATGNANCGMPSTGLADPGSNGVIKRTAMNVTSPAGSSDVVGLFSSCGGTQYLGADGNCHAGNPSGLGNASTIVDATLMPGSTFDVKGNNAVSNLPSAGGGVDFRGLTGGQSMNAPVNIGTSSQAVNFLFGPYTITQATGVNNFLLKLNSSIQGCGIDCTLIAGNGNGYLIASQNQTSGSGNNVISGVHVQNSYQGGGGVLDLRNMMYERVSNCSLAGQVGVAMGTVAGSGGGSYYNSISDCVLAGGQSGVFNGTALDLGYDANSNEFSNDVLVNYPPGQYPTVRVVENAVTNIFNHPDIETTTLPFCINGVGTVVRDGYVGNGVITNWGTWAANTVYEECTMLYANGDGWIQVASGSPAGSGGTSGATAPNWSSCSTAGCEVTDGTCTWMLVSTGSAVGMFLGLNAADNIWEGASAAGSSQSVVDARCLVQGFNCFGSPEYNKVHFYNQESRYGSMQFGYLFGGDPSNATNGGNRLYLGRDYQDAGGTSMSWGLDVDYVPNNFSSFSQTAGICTTSGFCGAAPLHAGWLGTTGGATFLGQTIFGNVPAPPAPTLSYSGAAGSNSYTFALVAHCGNGVTTVGAQATMSNVGTLSSTNTLAIQLPMYFSSPSGYWYTYKESYYGGCTWDILSYSGGSYYYLAETVRPASGVYNWTGTPGPTQNPYTVPTTNTAGGLFVPTGTNLSSWIANQLTFNTGGNAFVDMAAAGEQLIHGYNTPKNTAQTCEWQFYNNSTDHQLLFKICSQGSSSGTNTVQTLYNTLDDGSGDISTAGYVSVASSKGYQINGTAASGQYLRGNGTAFVSSAIQGADVPALTINGQTCTSGGSCNVNSGASQYTVAVNGGAGAAIGGVGPGTAGQILKSAGPGANPSFADFVASPVVFHAANCNNATASAIWSLPTSGAPTVACRTGTNVQAGVLQFAQSNSAQFQVDIPGDWDSSSQVYAKIYFTQGANTTGSQTITMQMATGCSSTTDDPSFNTAQNFGTATTGTTANAPYTETISGVTMTGCSSGGNMNLKISRSSSDTATTAPNVYWISLTFQRQLAAQAN